jgi:hypothetical protein
MNNADLDQMEDFGNKQLDFCKDVIEDLETLSNCTVYETGNYELSNLFQADYCTIDRYATLTLIERGYGGDPNREVGTLLVDPLISAGKDDEFIAKFRSEALIIFNKARCYKRDRLLRQVQDLQAEIEELQGDVE